jgi:hypothetical protein
MQMCVILLKFEKHRLNDGEEIDVFQAIWETLENMESIKEVIFNNALTQRKDYYLLFHSLLWYFDTLFIILHHSVII